MKPGLFVFALLIATSADAFEDVDGTFHKIGENDQRVTMELVDLAVPDGQSVRFRRVFQKSNLICGYINAKNTIGAYTGYRKFYVSLDQKYVSIEAKNPEQRDQQVAELENRTINSLCQFRERGF